jgi:hypothetical protein
LEKKIVIKSNNPVIRNTERRAEIQTFPPMTRLALLSKILGILAGWMMPPETSQIYQILAKEIIIFG